MGAPDTLDTLIDELLAWEFQESPVSASALGVPGYDDRVGDYSAEAFDRRRRREVEWLERFEGVAAEVLSTDEAIDRDLVISDLKGRAIMHDWEGWRRSPDAYLGACLYGVFVLFLHRLLPEADLVDAAVARLEAVPDVLDCGRRNLDPDLATPLLVRRALAQCQAAMTYARELVPAEVGEGAGRERLAKAGEVAAGAFESFAAFLDELAGRSAGSFAVGEERYSRLLVEREGLSYGAADLRERGRSAYEDLAADMARRAHDLAGTDDFRAVVADLNGDHPATPREMEELYRDWTARARAFLAEHDLVSFAPGEDCRVEPSPHFQRPMIAVASYSRPPAFTESRVGHFFVPYPPEGASDEEVQQRLSTNARHTIPSVSVHEAYPGHHWHLSMAAGNPRPARKVFGTSYFAEGWALYTEQMMREEGFFTDPRQELCQLDMRLFRAARIVVDTSLHVGDMGSEEATEFMQDKAGLAEPVARAEVARYCAWPTQAASYLTGSLEIERIRERYLAAGTGDLRTFHDTIAASGNLPLALAERAALGGEGADRDNGG